MRKTSLSFVFCLLSFLTATSLFAAVPTKINLVGQLDAVPTGETDGSPASATVMYMVFRLYDQPGLGRDSDKAAALWGRQAAVMLENGIFDVDLEDGLGAKVDGAKYDSLADAIDAALARGSSVLYVGITPEKDTHAEIFPRLRLTSVAKAVQAATIRTVPDNFEVGNGVFSAKELVVEKTATLGQTDYDSVAFGPKGSIAFDGGLEVTTASAGNVELSDTLRAPTVVAQNLAPQATLTVSGPVTVAGSPTVSGDIGTSLEAGPTVAVSVVSAPVTGKIGAAGRLVLAGGFKNESNQGFDAAEGVAWNTLGSWQTVDGTAISDIQSEGSTPVTCWDESLGTSVLRTSVTAGLWSAPCDCIAYFQTHLLNRSTQIGACVQFYLVDSTSEKDFTSRPPNAVASLRNGDSATLDTVVAMILNKGQLVKWLGVNGNANETTTFLEPDDSCVRKITYRAFNW